MCVSITESPARQSMPLPQALLFFDETRGTPVLLSLLVLIFSEDDKSQAGVKQWDKLPHNRFELYYEATRAAVRRACQSKGDDQMVPTLPKLDNLETTLHVLSRVATAAHLDHIRDFKLKFIQKKLQKDELDQWKSRLGNGTLPLVKTLETAYGAAELEGNQYQFKHLSIQEAFFAMAVVSNEEKWNPAEHLENRWKQLSSWQAVIPVSGSPPCLFGQAAPALFLIWQPILLCRQGLSSYY